MKNKVNAKVMGSLETAETDYDDLNKKKNVRNVRIIFFLHVIFLLLHSSS